jgi:hypothetical protein
MYKIFLNNTDKLKLYALRVKSTLYLECILLFGPESFCLLFYAKSTRSKVYGTASLPCFI